MRSEPASGALTYFAAHPTAANILMLALAAAGLLTLPNMLRETMPEVDLFEARVSVPYPGASAATIETAICEPLEAATDAISFIDERRCEARDNLGQLTLKMVEDGDMQRFLDDVRTAVDGVDNLPPNSERPIVTELGRTSPVISVALLADLERDELKDAAERVQRDLQRLDEIPIVEVAGFADRQLRIEVPAHNLRRYGISLSQLARVVGEQAIDVPLGEVETADRNYQIRFDEERRTSEELEALIVVRGVNGGEVRLGEIARVVDTFELREEQIVFDGRPAALLHVRKNRTDDSLRVLAAVEQFVADRNAQWPAGMRLVLTQDYTSIVKDRLQMLTTNAWQGLLLVVAVLYLFFSARYTLWVALGLPVSFLGSFALITAMGISLNMISLVGLLIAIGILMDDAIVIAESIASRRQQGATPLAAVVEGTRIVARGVLSSFVTSVLVFGGLAFIEGNLGQVLKVMPMVLISVLAVSLIEAFWILPAHLRHAMDHEEATPAWKQRFTARFESWRERVGVGAELAVRYRYATVGGAIAILVLSISLIPAGLLKFRGFPDLDGDILQARILAPQGTPLAATERIVEQVLNGLKAAGAELAAGDDLIRHVNVTYGQNLDAFETGPHVATISVDLKSADQREVSIDELTHVWREQVGDVPQAQWILYKEPALGPAGRAIFLRLQHDDLATLTAASWTLQQWLSGYPGVIDIIDDLRPGKPQLTVKMKSGAYAAGLEARHVADQLRAAFQGIDVNEVQHHGETFEIQVRLDDASRSSLGELESLPVIHPQTGAHFPLTSIAELTAERDFGRIQRVDGQRAVSVFADVDPARANATQVVTDTQRRLAPELVRQFPGLRVSVEGELKNSMITGGSVGRALLVGAIGIYLLLCLQFRSYVEPAIVLITIPLAFIGVLWGHVLMGLDLSMPSMMGFVSLAGIVVNDSILLVEQVKRRSGEGLSVHDAASHASRDRFRAIFLTSLTTIAGLLPLLLETSLQAQILIPLVTSIAFGISTSTVLILLVLPALYSILEDLGYSETTSQEREATPAAI